MRLSNSMLQPRWNPAVLDKNRLFYALWTTGLFLLLIWGVYGINEVYGMNWRRLGNHPREWNHVGGVFIGGDGDAGGVRVLSDCLVESEKAGLFTHGTPGLAFVFDLSVQSLFCQVQVSDSGE